MRSRVRAAAAAVALWQLAPLPALGQSLTLAGAVDSALASHPALERVDARRTGAEEGARIARAARWPSLGLEMSVVRFQEPMVTTPIHGFDPDRLPAFDRSLVQGSLGLRHTLVDWGGRSSATAVAETDVGAMVAAARATRATVIERVAEAFVRVVTARAVDAAAGARVQALESEQDRVKRGLDAGSAAEVEALRASVALQDARAERTSSAAAVRLAERNLARLMGTSGERVEEAELVEPLVSAARSGGSPDRNPEVEQAFLRAEAARARIGGRRADRLPRIDVTGGLMDYGTLTGEHVLEWQAGMRLSWSIFAGGAQAAGIRRAEADLLAAEREIEAIMLGVESGADAARTSIEAADARVAALEGSVSQWNDLVRIEALSLEVGSGMQRDLLDAEASLFRARAGLVEARAEAAMARIRLAAALGELDRRWIDDFAGESR